MKKKNRTRKQSNLIGNTIKSLFTPKTVTLKRNQPSGVAELDFLLEHFDY